MTTKVINPVKDLCGRTDLQNSEFHGDFSESNFSYTNLTGSRFIDADLTDANFEGSIMRGVEFYSSSLINVNFLSADLENVIMKPDCAIENIDLTKAKIVGIQILPSNAIIQDRTSLIAEKLGVDFVSRYVSEST